MKITEFTQDTTIYSVPFYNEQNGIPSRIEIYKFNHIEGRLTNEKIVFFHLNTIIGSSDFYLEIPFSTDLEQPLLIRHKSDCWWFYTTSEEKAVEYFEKYLNGEFPDKRVYWDETACDWGHTSEDFDLRE